MHEVVSRIHFIGIGGSGMSGIADVLIKLGYKVSGSDTGSPAILESLSNNGAVIYNQHCAENVSGVDAVVVSSAIEEENPEIIAARESRIPVVRRAEMLGELMRFRRGIAIAGTHGKTTCTSLTAAILIEDALDPTFVIGGVVRSMRKNSHLGKGQYMVVEADESDASFLHLQPHFAIVTNIDADHMGTYGNDFDVLSQTFLDFLANLPFYGRAILCADDANVMSIVDRVTKPVVLYGESENADVRCFNIEVNQAGMRFDVKSHLLDEILSIELGLPGVHNVLNATAAITAALLIGVKTSSIKKALSQFEGIDRRFQMIGYKQLNEGTALLIDDYAHHPSEIRATIEAARGVWPDKRVVVIFQPHRYTRTRDLLDDFANVLYKVDVLAVAPVYAASELPSEGENSASLCRAIRAHAGVEPVLMEDIEELSEVIVRLAKDGDVVLCLGAGDISRIAHNTVDIPYNESKGGA